MKLCTFEINQQRRVGALVDGQVIDVSASYNAYLAAHGPKPGALRVLPSEMLSFVRLGPLSLDAARECINFVLRRSALPVGEQVIFPVDAVTLLAPIARPGKIVCSKYGLSADEPSFYFKAPSTVVGPSRDVAVPASVERLNAQGCLAAIIGPRSKAVSVDQALTAIFGFTLLLDIGVEAAGSRANEITLWRNYDCFCPLGPFLLTVDEIEALGSSEVNVSVNGKARQHLSAMELVQRIQRMITSVSAVMTLEPGDILGAGSASPDGQGNFVDLRIGDKITAELSGIGCLENRLVSE